MTLRLTVFVLLGGLAFACGGSTQADGSGGAPAGGGTSGSGAAAGTGASAGTGAKPGKNSGDCDTDADCAGGKCVELVPGGYRVCVMPVVEATACQNQSMGVDECCNSGECKTGKCFAFPATPYCGGAMPIDHNVCASDGCELGTICPVGNETTGQCIPGGAWGYKVSSCLIKSCIRDVDCNAEPGGACIPIQDPCCGAPQGFYCSYPSDGCKGASDCKPTESCMPEFDTTRGQWVAKCKEGMVGCPA